MDTKKCRKHLTDECGLWANCPNKKTHICGCAPYRETLGYDNKVKFDKFIK